MSKSWDKEEAQKKAAATDEIKAKKSYYKIDFK